MEKQQIEVNETNYWPYILIVLGLLLYWAYKNGYHRNLSNIPNLFNRTGQAGAGGGFNFTSASLIPILLYSGLYAVCVYGLSELAPDIWAAWHTPPSFFWLSQVALLVAFLIYRRDLATMWPLWIVVIGIIFLISRNMDKQPKKAGKDEDKKEASSGVASDRGEFTAPTTVKIVGPFSLESDVPIHFTAVDDPSYGTQIYPGYGSKDFPAAKRKLGQEEVKYKFWDPSGGHASFRLHCVE